MFSRTTGEFAAEHSAPLTIASDGGAMTPSAPHAAAAAGGAGAGAGVGVGVGVGRLGAPPPHAARQTAATHAKSRFLIEVDPRLRGAGLSILPPISVSHP
jgi:hypothetical protein